MRLPFLIKDAVGHESAFEQRHGYYADILRPAVAESLPAGWESRLHPVAGYDNVFALDLYDLALVKLLVGRPKDLELPAAGATAAQAKAQPLDNREISRISSGYGNGTLRPARAPGAPA